MRALHPQLAGNARFSDAPTGPTWETQGISAPTPRMKRHKPSFMAQAHEELTWAHGDPIDEDGVSQAGEFLGDSAMDVDVHMGPPEAPVESVNESDTESLLDESTHQQFPDFRGDWVLANSILLMRDGIWFLEVCRAVALGDIGRVWEVLKVSAHLDALF